MTFNPRPKQGKKPPKTPKPLKRTAIKVNPNAKPLKRTPIKVNPNAKPLKRTALKPSTKPIARGEFKPKVRKKARTAKEKDHISAVVEIGCIACLNMGILGTPAQLHHPRYGQGMSQKSPDDEGIPLCVNHHMAEGEDGFHKHPETWVLKHGTERELLSQVRNILGIEDTPTASEKWLVDKQEMLSVANSKKVA